MVVVRAPARVASKTTTYGIVARDAPTVVIFRRGPTRHTRLLCWDLRDDTVHAGQWLVGRVLPGPCGLSPDGKLLIYEARKGARTFTAISRPPYFTALAFWEYSSPWTGGGFFSANATVVLGLNLEDPQLAAPFPPGFEVTNAWTYFSASSRTSAAAFYEVVSEAPQANHGWWKTSSGVVQKPSPTRRRMRLERIRAGRAEHAYRLVEDARVRELGVLDWADWSHDGDLLLGAGGCLHRQPLLSSLAKDLPVRSLVADLRDQVFERVLAPDEMRRWPARAGAKRRSAR